MLRFCGIELCFVSLPLTSSPTLLPLLHLVSGCGESFFTPTPVAATLLSFNPCPIL